MSERPNMATPCGEWEPGEEEETRIAFWEEYFQRNPRKVRRIPETGWPPNA